MHAIPPSGGLLRGGLISTFFQEVGRVKLAKEHLHMDGSMGVTLVDTKIPTLEFVAKSHHDPCFWYLVVLLLCRFSGG